MVNPGAFNRAKRKHADDMYTRKSRSNTFACHYCGKTLTRQTATKEHLRPQSQGGGDTRENIVFACMTCNSTRGTENYEAFKQHMLPAKQAREAGLPPPYIPPFHAIKQKRGDSPRRARHIELERAGYTKTLLLGCISAHQMLAAGHSLETIAAHNSCTIEAARAMIAVGAARPENRLDTAASENLIALLKAK